MSLTDAKALPVKAAGQIVEAASRANAAVNQFLVDSMDPDDRPLEADMAPGDFFAKLRHGEYDEED